MKKLGKYELIGELGRGAMGIVYRARDPIISRLVALKTITAGVSDNQSLLQRFYREAQAAGGLQHPNIITIYDMGDEGGTPFIAMELVEGESLEQLISNKTDIPLSLKLTYAIQACRAFDYAHKRGIIHRDIKPANVMLSKDGIVKVVDFGIARVVENSKTQTGLLMGTFAYMSPEQYHGEHADERSDIWSFGILLYELLFYQRPFAGEAPASLMHSICSQEPAPLGPDCPPELDAIIKRTLHKSPTERFQTMEDLLLELDPICKGLQAVTVTNLVAQSQGLVKQGDYSGARDVLRQALQVDSSNPQARILLERVNTELRRILIRPKAQEFVARGHALLAEGKITEARTEAESALQLDPGFEPAQELSRLVQEELDKSQMVAEYLEQSRLCLVEGMPDEAEALLLKVIALEPSNKLVAPLQEQIANEKALRARRLRLLDTMQQARSLWTLQNYAECIRTLIDLQGEFPQEEEVPRLLETVREDQAEQRRRQMVERARNLLAAGKHEESTTLLSSLQQEFPNDAEIAGILREIAEDLAKQRRQGGLADARRLLGARQYDEGIAVLEGLQQEFGDDPEIAKLLDAVQVEKANQQRQQGISKARKLLTARRYEECTVLLTKLQAQFPSDDEISRLLTAVREEEAEQQKSRTLAEVGNLLSSHRHEESIALLEQLLKQYPGDAEVLRLIDAVHSDQAEQRKLTSLARARKLLSDRQYDEAISLLGSLQDSFPAEGEAQKLLQIARTDRAEQQKQEQLSQARQYLAAGRVSDAFALLEILQKQHPEDSAVQKLWKLVQAERENQAKLELLQKEFTIIKALVNDKNYGEALTRAEKINYSGDANLTRLVDFARARQQQLEKEVLLQKTLDQVKSLVLENRFPEAIRAAKDGLRNFPNNQELVQLQQQAEGQEKKLQTRKAIEQRIREIKVKINRDNYSEAIEMARATLVTLGPSTAVTQLLNSAQVEFETREKKRKQEKELEEIRARIESGKLDEATKMLDVALSNNKLEAMDPRVKRVADDLDNAKNRSNCPPSPPSSQPPEPPGLAREYAYEVRSPQPRPVDNDPLALTQMPSPSSSGPPAAYQSAAPPAPPAEPAKAPELVQPVSFAPPPAEVVPPPVTPVEKSAVSQPPVRKEQVNKPSAPPAPTVLPLWKRPAVAAGGVVVLVVVMWAGMHVFSGKGQQSPSVVSTSQPATATPHVNPMEVRQRDAINEADKDRAAGDLQSAADELERASALNGPLTAEIQKKQDQIREEMNNKTLADLGRRQEQLWLQAQKEADRSQFNAAEQELQKIVAEKGGPRNNDAQNYLDKVIPQRKEEERIFARAKQTSQANDASALRQSSNTLSQIIASGGARKSDAEQLQRTVQSKLDGLAREQQRSSELASLKTEANQALARGDIAAARQNLAQLKSKGADTASLSGDIQRYEENQKQEADRQNAESEYQKLVQQYQQATNANDKSGMEASRSAFAAIARAGGAHSAEARDYANKLTARLAPPVTPPAVVTPPTLAPTVSKADRSGDERQIQAVLNQYQQAFNERNADMVRAVWPNISKKIYSGYSDLFKAAGAIQMHVTPVSTQFNENTQGATVVASVEQEVTAKGQKKATNRVDRFTFELVRQNGGWVISQVR